MTRMLFGATVGMMAGMALMMSPVGKTLKKEIHMGMHQAKKMARQMEEA